MNNNNLTSVLQQNSAFLGDKYERIGKDNGSNFFGRKILLSHDKKTGWKIVKLNSLQLLFRNYFGLYRNTHLKHIFKRLSKEKLQQEILDLPFYSHISKIWAEKCLRWLGNASVDKAQVICFGENHGDVAYRAVVQKFINENYCEGDIVLVEGRKAGQVVKPGESQLTRELNEGCLVMGWEPQNVEEVNQELFKLNRTKHQELSELIEFSKKNFLEKPHFQSSDISLITENLENIGNKILELNQYYQSKDPQVLNVKKFISILLEEVIQKSGNLRIIYFGIIDTLAKLEKKQEKAMYQNLTIDDQNQVIKNASFRNLSLIQEISKNRHEGRRVFVIGGLAHFIQTSYETNKNQVKEELSKHQFIVLGRKKMIDKFFSLNRDISHIVDQ